jgi:hypothetical protein
VPEPVLELVEDVPAPAEEEWSALTRKITGKKTKKGKPTLR